jgi:hypothetical protein
LIKTCAEFNIAEEFHSFIDYLENDNKQLKSTGVKHQASEFLEQVVAVCNALSDRQSSRSKVKLKEERSEESFVKSTRLHQSPTTAITASHSRYQLPSKTIPKEKVVDRSLQNSKHLALSTNWKTEHETKCANDNSSNTDIGSSYRDAETDDEQNNADATNLRIKEFQDDIDRHIRTAQDEEEIHLLKLYRLMKKKEKSELLRGAKKLAGIH